MPRRAPQQDHWTFERRWGPAAIIASVALVFTVLNLWQDKSAALDRRVTIVETQNAFIVETLKRIEIKIDGLAK